MRSCRTWTSGPGWTVTSNRALYIRSSNVPLVGAFATAKTGNAKLPPANDVGLVSPTSNPVRRGGHHDVVRRAVAAEAAVLPDDVDLAVRVDLGRGQRRGAQVARDGVLADAGDQDRSLPRGAAVDRAERADARATLVGDDHVAVRLDDRLSTQAVATH